MRLLLDPNPADAGGNPAPVPPANPAFASPPAGAPTPPAAPPANPAQPPPAPAPPADTLTLPRSEAERLYGLPREIERLNAEREQAIEAARLEAIQQEAARGEQERQAAINRLNDESTQRYNALRDQWLASERGRTVASALAAPPTPFVSDFAARQVASIIEADTEAVLQPDGSVAVRDRRTGRPAGEVIAERLASPEFAHFLRPASQGGSGGTGPTPAPSGGPPPSLKDTILGHLRQTYGAAGG